MSNSFFNHTNRLVRFDSARAEDLNSLLDSVSSGLDGVEVKTNAAIKLPDGETAVALPAAGSRANKVMSFDALGAPTTNDVSVADIAAANANAATATAGANTATTQAGIATTQAGIATTKAAEAAASAVSIAGGPVASVNGMTGAVTGIATTGGNTYTGSQNEAHGADIASASTINLTTATGNLIDVTGTTTITAITLADGAERTVRFTGALTLTNGASLVLPGGANITTASGDFAIFRGYAAGVVRCVDYSKADGTPVVSAGGGALIYLSTVIASNSATVDIEATFNSTYDAYVLVANGIDTQNDGVALLCRLKIGGAYATDATYGFATISATAGSGISTITSSTDTSIRLSNNVGNAATESANLFIEVFDPTSTALNKSITYRSGTVNETGKATTASGSGVYAGSAAALTGVRIFAEAGNIVAGNFRLYGIKKS